MIEKPKLAWPEGEISPWKGKAVRPTVREVARAYPGRALSAVFVSAILSAFVAAPIIPVLDWIANAAGLSLDGSGTIPGCRVAVRGVWAGGRSCTVRSAAGSLRGTTLSSTDPPFGGDTGSRVICLRTANRGPVGSMLACR